MDDEDVWFEPKRFGIGAGMPVKWQGWAVLLGYLAVISIASLLWAERHPVLFAVAALLSTLPLMAICAQHTRGGWRWRWGERQ